MKKRFPKIAIIICAALIVLIPLIIWIAWGNKALELNELNVESEKIPEAFSGYRIAQVSDLHNAEFGDGNEELIEMLVEASPDIIVITGDIIDSRNTSVDTALYFVKQAVSIAPCYFVTGNHESRVPEEFESLENKLMEMGVTVLRNEAAVLEKDGETVTLAGIDDPTFGDDCADTLSQLSDTEGYRILLSHRPELFATYVENEFDLVFSGHAHGGQVRLPLIGGLAAPGQGVFPEYTEGIYTDGNTSMVVSRGLGNSIFPFRVNNRPEVVLVKLISN